MNINFNTQLCISLAQRPSNFGTNLFNAAFAAARLNFLYKAFALPPEHLAEAVAAMRTLDIRGCGISMPFKEEAMRYVDTLDPWARRIGAINTIVNTRGYLKGYNTDAVGAQVLLQPLARRLRHERVILLGAGGAARAICAALNKLGAEKVWIVNRTPKEAQALAQQWQFTPKPWKTHLTSEAYLFINATPIGMMPYEKKSPLTPVAVKNYDVIMDVVIKPLNTKLAQQAIRARKKLLPGWQMALQQAARQFELYTGHPAPLRIMKQAIRRA